MQHYSAISEFTNSHVSLDCTCSLARVNTLALYAKFETQHPKAFLRRPGPGTTRPRGFPIQSSKGRVKSTRAPLPFSSATDADLEIYDPRTFCEGGVGIVSLLPSIPTSGIRACFFLLLEANSPSASQYSRSLLVVTIESLRDDVVRQGWT
jgi:hypothetical protein